MYELEEFIKNFCHQYSITPENILTPSHIYMLEELLQEIEKHFGEEATNFVATVLFEEACQKEPDLELQIFCELKQQLTEEEYKQAIHLYSKVKLEKDYFGRENLYAHLLTYAKVYS